MTMQVMRIVLTAHFKCTYNLAPNNLDMTTEQPALLPTAIAIKIMVMG